MNTNKFYVYIYLDPRKKGSYIYENLKFEYEPFYVGKGKGYRCKTGLKDKTIDKKDKINEIQFSNNEPIIVKIFSDLLETEALHLETKTIKLIGRLNINKGPLVNLTDGGTGMTGYNHNEEWKTKISKPILQYSLNEELIAEFPSIKLAAKVTGIIKQNIGACINGRYKTSGGFIWKYKNSANKLQGHLKEPAKMPKHSEETKTKISISNKTNILQYNIEGIFIKEWSSIKKAANYYNIIDSSISACCSGRYKTSGGFIWKYKTNENYQITIVSNKYKAIIQFDKNHNFIKEWISAKEIERYLKLSQISIRNSCNKGGKLYKGYIWQYKEV